MSIVYSSYTEKNNLVFGKILSLYAAPGNKIIDVTYGKGNFWKDIDTSLYDFCPSDLTLGIDMRNLPYETGSIDVEVIDPPYMYNPKGTIKDSLADTYNINGTEGLYTTSDIISLYTSAFVEARRVLKRKSGILIVKCQDGIESNKQRWNHISLFMIAESLGFSAEDFFIVTLESSPTIRWEDQKHSRKNHSYFWVFKRGR